jgi:hypothetical protein
MTGARSNRLVLSVQITAGADATASSSTGRPPTRLGWALPPPDTLPGAEYILGAQRDGIPNAFQGR